MLPIFIRKWNLDDGQAGLFSSVQFLFALVGRWFQVLAWLGAGTGHRWLPVTPNWIRLATLNASTHVNALAATAAFGLGYGSSLREPTCTSGAGGARSASLLNLLNFTWASARWPARRCSPWHCESTACPAFSLLRDFGGLLAFALLFARFGAEKHEKPVAATEATQ